MLKGDVLSGIATESFLLLDPNDVVAFSAKGRNNDDFQVGY
jgi:hypothetical protein